MIFNIKVTRGGHSLCEEKSIMACSRAENNHRNPVPRISWTIDEFCASVGISRSTYEKAKRDGWGPREMVLGSTGIRIADEARADWIASREKAASIAAERRERRSGPAAEKTAT